jgi:hypothetical protein
VSIAPLIGLHDVAVGQNDEVSAARSGGESTKMMVWPCGEVKDSEESSCESSNGIYH